MRSSSGFSLVEVLIALVIIGFVLTTSLAVFFDRERRLQAADELLIASQAMAIEAEVLRQTSYSDIPVIESREFVSSPAILTRLNGCVASETIVQDRPSLKRIVLTVSWNEGRKRSELVTYRSDTGGGNLW